MPNYQDGKIYSIVCNITDECYIGSTCEPTVARRLATHVRSYRVWKAGKHHKTSSFDIIDRGDYQIFLIETYPCNSKDELHSREGEIIRKYKSECECVNSYIAGRTNKAYYQDNKDTIKKKVKEYCNNNKDKIQEYKKEYRVKNIEMLSQKKKQYKKDNKEAIQEKDKQYRLDHKEKAKEYMKEYRKDNKNKISEHGKVKITCACGSCFRKADKNRHEKTHKHQLYSKSIE